MDYKTMIKDYNHLPIGKYFAILELAKQDDNDVAIVATLADKTEDECLNMPLTEYRELADAAGFLFYQPAAAPCRKTYKVGGFTLRLQAKADKITTAQYLDFKEYAKAEGSTMWDFLAVVLIPEGHNFNEGYDVAEVRDAIRDGLPVPDALGIRDFFARRLGKLTAASLTFSERTAKRIKDKGTRKEMMTKVAEAREAFLTSGDGLPMLMKSQPSHAALGVRYIR